MARNHQVVDSEKVELYSGKQYVGVFVRQLRSVLECEGMTVDVVFHEIIKKVVKKEF